MKDHFERPYQESKKGLERDPEKVKAIVDWLESKSGWASGKTLAEYAADAPDVSRDDLRAMFLDMKPRDVGNAPYDSRGYYITALAHRIIEQQFLKWQVEHPNASEEELNEWWNAEGKVELAHPETGPYPWDRFREMGHGWEKGTLILRGNYGEAVGSSMRGGKVIVEGNTGPRAGVLMLGGELEINGTTGYELGYGMTGGRIHARKAAPSPGRVMHGGTIEIDEPIDLTLPGSNNVIQANPWIGGEKSERTGGRIIVAGEEY